MITTTYKDPDLDGYGCAVAYAELLRAQGKEAQAHIWGKPLLEVEWLLKTFHLQPAHGPIEYVNADVVLLDASKPSDLPGSLRAQQVIEVIDHRAIHEGASFQNAKIHIELVGAAATLVAERFVQAGIHPSHESALLLYGGILSNTQNLSSVATDRDKKMALWLKQRSQAPDDLAKQMFEAKSHLPGGALKEAILADLKVMTLGGHSVALAQLEIIHAQELVDKRIRDLTSALEEIHQKYDSEFTYINIKDLNSGVSSLYCLDERTKELLKDASETTWDGLIGTSKKFTLRKKMAPWIEQKLKAQ